MDEAGKFRVRIAAVCGVFVIGAALFSRFGGDGLLANVFQTIKNPDEPIATTTQRVIPTEGEWQETLAKFGTINTATSTQGGENASTTPDTFTDSLAKTLFETYLRGKSMGMYSTTEERQDLAKKFAAGMLAYGAPVPYTEKDIHIDAQTSLNTYIDAVMSAIFENTVDTEHELVIFHQAVTVEDPATLAKLDPIIEVYGKLLDDLLAMSVPKEAAETHVQLVNSIRGVYMGIRGMKQLYVDPSSALVHFAMYQRAVPNLTTALKATQKIGRDAHLTYPEGTPGDYLLVQVEFK